jgi:hypothetical protein
VPIQATDAKEEDKSGNLGTTENDAPTLFARGSNIAVAVVVSAASCFAFVALTRSPGQGKVPVGSPFTLVDDASNLAHENVIRNEAVVVDRWE